MNAEKLESKQHGQTLGERANFIREFHTHRLTPCEQQIANLVALGR
ncbi:hypothetical protein F7734_11030 [Scytonema sp. UIC 10036]|nr:hypothetical protein [Scytonema sp. UIC 10036]MUG92943.1 hypothetical protein [Scytonema sp. UIC 10036]